MLENKSHGNVYPGGDMSKNTRIHTRGNDEIELPISAPATSNSKKSPEVTGGPQNSTPRKQEQATDEEVPVVIVGAGPVGLIIALLLAREQIRSVVLEQAEGVSTAPRAVGFLGPVHEVFRKAGIFDQLVREGAQNGGEIWRNGPVVDDGHGGKKLSDIIADHTISKPDAKGDLPFGEFFIMIPQNRMAQILVEECQKTRLVDLRFNSKVNSITENENGVSVGIESSIDSSQSTVSGKYLAACDGGRSTIRKLLGISLAGHGWPERFIALDVRRTALTLPHHQIQYTVHPQYWGVVASLEKLEAGKSGMWRYALAVTDDSVPDEEVVKAPFLDELLLKQMDGPRPAEYEIINKSLYRMFNVLATTMHRGRCLLAGDAAHSNTPIGAMGLNTGFLDAMALAKTLEMVMKGKHPDHMKLFATYSARRRWVFQNIVDPISSSNKLRLHSSQPETAKNEDYFFQVLNSGDDKQVKEMFRPLWEHWRTDMLDSPETFFKPM
jgi:2-polyprenyl-6-methoxyphenol hydroxylase-like FAD-dependent oxidoreductase